MGILKDKVMKKHFLLIATFLLASSITKAQTNTYHPFPDSNAVWVTVWYYPFYPHTAYYTRVFIPINKQDTIINSKKYIKLFMDEASDEGGYQDTTYIGCIRNDTIGKVFFVPKDSSNEVLLYDFSKQAGDTIYDVYSYITAPFYSNYIVDSTSQMTIGPYLLKVLYLHPLSLYTLLIVWVEKIGCIGSGMPFTSNACLMLEEAVAVCATINDTLFYDSPSGGCMLSNFMFPYIYRQCYYPINVEEVHTISQINIFPNPFVDKINFENLPDEKVHIKIINIFDQEIYSIQLKNTNTISIPFENQAPGLYFISIQTESGIVIKKIIKL